mgnify:CR=1 FL=1
MSREKEIVHDIYQLLFQASTPPADFKQLLENATVNDKGQKEIPFMDHELEQDKFHDIMETRLKKSRLPKYKKELIKRTVLLGCSPKYK